MFLFSQPFLTQETEAGVRIVSWRVWLLIWLVPGLFAAAAVLLAAGTAYRYASTVPGEGEVVRVYAWQGETIFDRNQTNYGPVLRYAFAPDDLTDAGTGVSNPNWNFEIGTKMPIRYNPNRKGNVMLPGPHNWAVAWVIGLIAAVTALPALWGHRRVRRWQRAGT